MKPRKNTVKNNKYQNYDNLKYLKADPNICNCTDCGFNRVKGPCYLEQKKFTSLRISVV